MSDKIAGVEATTSRKCLNWFHHEMKAEWWRLRPKRMNNYLLSPVLEHDNPL